MFNVTRGDCPPSLKHNNNWNAIDVIESLAATFLNKCYICETKEPFSFNVEHIVAHRGDIEKKYDWQNLFFSCARCNNIKGDRFNNLLDCTDPTLDTLRLIKHRIPSSPADEVIITPQNDSAQTLETAKLLNKVYNDNNTGNKKVSAISIRKSIFKRYYKLAHQMNIFIDEDATPNDKARAIEVIRHLMSKSGEYSAFLRWTVLEYPELLEQVGDAID